MQVFCKRPLFYLWPPSSLCLLLTLKLLHIHAWLFCWNQRSTSVHGTVWGQLCLTCQITKVQTKSTEQCCSYPELPKALPPPTQSSSVRAKTTATHDFTGLINCMTKDEALNSNHDKALWLSACGTKCFHAQNLITDRNSQAGQPHRKLSCFQCHDFGRKYLIVLDNHWQWLIKLAHPCYNRKHSSSQLTLSSFFSLTSYLCGRNLGGTHFLSSFFNEVGSFRGDLRARSSDTRRWDTVLLE